jgi:hypothetical protein
VFCIRSDTAPIDHQLFANRWLWLSLLAALGLQAAVSAFPRCDCLRHHRSLGRDWLTCLMSPARSCWPADRQGDVARVDRRAAMATAPSRVGMAATRTGPRVTRADCQDRMPHSAGVVKLVNTADLKQLEQRGAKAPV